MPAAVHMQMREFSGIGNGGKNARGFRQSAIEMQRAGEMIRYEARAGSSPQECLLHPDAQFRADFRRTVLSELLMRQCGAGYRTDARAERKQNVVCPPRYEIPIRGRELEYRSPIGVVANPQRPTIRCR